jgi:3-deoxy-D-manno-octulosonate 8-phosphate phosphatase (KDO 8-P phosphatase)
VERIVSVALDVDGVLTDGTFWWGPNGDEYKRFSFLDIMGISQARKAGILLALISGEDTPLVHRFATKMGIADVYAGCKDKAAALRDFAAKRGLALSQVCYMGDDINDVPAMEIAGLAAAPATAHALARAKATFITKSAGGQGAVRELMDQVMAGMTATPAKAKAGE